MVREENHSEWKILQLLANHRRRQILAFLADNTDAVIPIESLLEHLQSQTDRQKTSQEHDHWQQLFIECHHIHLPAFADYDLIEYDVSTQQIEYNGHSQTERLLDFGSELVTDEYEDDPGIC